MPTDNWKEYPVTVDAYWGTDDQGRMWSKFKRDGGKTETSSTLLDAVCIVCNKTIADKKEWVCLDNVEQACENCVIIEKTARDQIAHDLLKDAGLLTEYFKCPECGYPKLKDWFKFCSECGHRLEE